MAGRDGEACEERAVGEAGGGVCGHAVERACDETRRLACLEEMELVFEGEVAEFRPWLEAGEAVVRAEQAAVDFPELARSVCGVWSAQPE